MVPNYISEVTNNGLTISNYLMRNRCIDIVCVYCQKFYRYFTYKALKITPQNSIVCNECNMDSMIPITPSSCLYDMNPDERTNQINIWHDEWFEPIDCEPEYEDYEYEEFDYNFQETKDAYEYKEDEVPTLTLPDIVNSNKNK